MHLFEWIRRWRIIVILHKNWFPGAVDRAPWKRSEGRNPNQETVRWIHGDPAMEGIPEVSGLTDNLSLLRRKGKYKCFHGFRRRYRSLERGLIHLETHSITNLAIVQAHPVLVYATPANTINVI
jgi:hypothetical protein